MHITHSNRLIDFLKLIKPLSNYKTVFVGLVADLSLTEHRGNEKYRDVLLRSASGVEVDEDGRVTFGIRRYCFSMGVKGEVLSAHLEEDLDRPRRL